MNEPAARERSAPAPYPVGVPTPLPPRVVAVWTDDAGRVCAEFADGERRAFDLGPLLRLPIFEPLADLARLAEVAVIDDGVAVGWPNGADLWRGAIYERGERIPSGPRAPGRSATGTPASASGNDT
ncbi:MAG TPA: DUF2442 domain-containing protein [Rubricoccaceae bacterium]|nr:DUF2442 domain-containing protein [Rubricoccaceae bacterium]